jgi:hypothetical protein
MLSNSIDVRGRGDKSGTQEAEGFRIRILPRLPLTELHYTKTENQ